MALAGVFVGATIASVAFGSLERFGAWLPLHLLLAGAASTAIAGVMPFFSTAVSNAPPVAPAVRLAGVLGVAAGAALIVLGRLAPTDLQWLAGAGGAVYLLGTGFVAVATLVPLRSAIGVRRLFMGAIYGLALTNVAVGATLGTGFLLGWQPIIGAWATLKPAHAWLNVFGFVSLAIAGSLLHLLPTVVGARITRTTASRLCFIGFAVGPPAAALGFVLRIDALAIAGAVITLCGGLALAWHAALVLRAHGHWRTDAEWHAFTSGSLVAGIAWFVIAGAIAVGQVLAGGASAGGWSLAPLALPLGLGWTAQILVGSWSHLVPAIGPGTPAQHARQRSILGWAGRIRLVALNVGLAIAVGGQLAGLSVALYVGMGVVLAAGLAAVILLGAAVLVLFGSPNRAARSVV